MERTFNVPKWRQFLEDAKARWDFLNPDDQRLVSLDDLVIQLSEAGGFSIRRSRLEVKLQVDLFEEKIHRAA